MKPCPNIFSFLFFTGWLILILFGFSSVLSAQSGKPLSLKLPALIPYRSGDLWGYADSTGTLKIKPRYRKAEAFEGAVARVADSTSWGLIDQKGKEITKQQYKEIRPFEHGLAYTLSSNGEVGVINSRGQLILTPVYQKVQVENLKDLDQIIIKASIPKNLDYKAQMTRIQKTNTSTGLFKPDGKPLLPVVYDHISYLGSGLFSVFLGADAGIFRIDGSEVLPLKPQVPGLLKEGLIMLSQQQRLGFVDTTGKEVIPLVYEGAQDFSEGLASVIQIRKWGYINKENRMVIPPTFDAAGPFQRGLAIVRKESMWGIIDKTGKPVADFIYRQIAYSPAEDCFILDQEYQKQQAFYDPKTGQLDFVKGYFVSSTLKNGLRLAVKTVDEHHGVYKKGFVNKTGQVVIPLEYFDATFFHYGLAAVRKDNSWGVIDTTGRMVIPFMFSKIEIVGPDLLKVGMETGLHSPVLYGLINRAGEEITPVIYTFIEPFNNGLAVVRRKNSVTIINTKGKEVIPLPQIPTDYYLCEEWKNGLIKICNYRLRQEGYIDRYGKQYFKD